MSAVVLQDGVRIPAGIDSLEEFRRWAKSDELPERGRFAYLRGEIWVDLSMEQAFSHNQVKAEFSEMIRPLVKVEKLGFYFTDGMLLTMPEGDSSTVPDGVIVSTRSVRSRRIEFVEGSEGGYVELLGTPDMVLEVVSDNSVTKDTVELRVLYYEVGVREYWLVDARSDETRFELLQRGSRGFVAAHRQPGGWLRSRVFSRSFRLVRGTGPLGYPQFTVEVRI